MLGDLLSRGLDQLVKRGEMRINDEMVDRILIIDLINFRALICLVICCHGGWISWWRGER
jgi:hypothetical protein